MGRKLTGSVAAVALVALVAGCGETTDKVTAGASMPAATSSAGKTAAKAKAGGAAKSTPTAKPAAPKVTVAQEQAIEAAQSYIDMSAFSKKGLIEQLSSSAGDGYSKADVKYAVEHITVDWNAEAREAAKNYLEMSHFSRADLLQQLTSSYGDGYTRSQALQAVKSVGL